MSMNDEKLSRELLIQMATPEYYPLAVGMERRMAQEMLDYQDEITALKQDLKGAHEMQSGLARDVQALSRQVDELQNGVKP